jgi:hypothetical protein
MPRSLFHKILFLGIRIQAKRLVWQFEKNTKRPLSVQERALLEKIRRNESSVFGREHGFANIRSIADFRKALPVRDYTYFEPYIERVKRGELSAMFGPGERLIMFSLTSGTTGKPKYIPITTSFVKSYRRTALLWGAWAYYCHPALIENKILPIVSSIREEVTETGVPCGAASGLHAQSQRYLGRALYAVPGIVCEIHDSEAKYYTVMRLGAAESVSIVSTPNPSTMIAVAKAANAHKESIIRDIRDGTLSKGFDIPHEIREALKKRLRPNPKRAKELEEVVRRTGRLLPKDFWPDLTLIASWKGGPLRSYLPMYPEYYGDVPSRDLGLIASEGRMSVPISDDGSSGILDIESNFFEFIPEDQEESENPDTLLCTELETGKRYFIVLTTASGLYRYNIYDLIEVTGFHNGTPLITFLNKGRHMSSLTGEKIHESQVVEAVHHASEGIGQTIEAFTLCPCWDGTPHYLLMIEESRLPDAGTEERFIRKVDASLRRLNMEYEKKRESNRLDAMTLVLVANGSFDRLRRETIAHQRGRAEQYKHPFLAPEQDFVKRFTVVRSITPK